MWFVLLCFSVIIGFINPYVSLFSIIMLFQLVVMGCFGLVICKNVRQSKKELSAKRVVTLKRDLRRYLFYFCTADAVLYGVSTFITLVVHMLLSGQLDGKVTGISIDVLGLKGNFYECNSLLVLQLLFETFSMFLAVSKAYELLSECQDV